MTSIERHRRRRRQRRAGRVLLVAAAFSLTVVAGTDALISYARSGTATDHRATDRRATAPTARPEVDSATPDADSATHAAVAEGQAAVAGGQPTDDAREGQADAAVARAVARRITWTGGDHSAPHVVALPAVPIQLVVLGDSVPAGAACACPNFGAALARHWPIVVHNAALGGLTSTGLLAQLASPSVRTMLHAADIVTVTIGANDFDESAASNADCADLHCYTAAMRSTTEAITAITARIHRATRPGTTIIVTGYWNVFEDGKVGALLGRSYVSTSNALTLRVNAILARVAHANGAVYADLYRPFKGRSGTADDTSLLAADGDHPDAAGHRLIAAVIASAARLP